MILGLPEAVVAGAVRAVTADAGDDLDRRAIAERFARAAWSHLTEPGDGVAGAVVAALGAHDALDLLVADADPRRFARQARERGIDVDADELAAGADRWRPRLRANDVLRALTQAQRFAVQLVVPDDRCWPHLVDDLGPHAPLALWVRGRPAALAALDRGIALVGARAATGYGEHVTVELASGLVDRGYAIVSGAAYGIDGVAHRTALAGRPAGDSLDTTIAVLAGGLDRFYPSGHESLLSRVAERGAVVAEVPCGTAPTRWRFLQRNRLIAAGSLATIVVEAGWRSGSINTANHAEKLGRPVGAVPGPVTSSASVGCHRLLRDGPATCITSADDVAELAPLPPTAARLPTVAATASVDAASLVARVEPMTAARRDPTGTRTRLLDALSARSPRTAAKLAEISGLALDRVRAELGLLELEGGARERPTGWLRTD